MLLMKIYLKYEVDTICRTVLTEQLERLNVSYAIIDSGCVAFKEHVPLDQYNLLVENLLRYNISLLDNNNALLVQKIKNLITEVSTGKKSQLIKMSAYLENQLGMTYRSIAKIFSDMCYMPIEEFVILTRIETVKKMLLNNTLTLTEIAFSLNYSSVAHLSNQFKKQIGICPREFQDIMLSK